jgi:hypothetical protein
MVSSSSAIALGLLLLGFAVPAQAQSGSSAVLQPGDTPQGYTLGAMAETSATFMASGNDPQYYPTTPFLVLHVPPGDRRSEQKPDGGIAITGSGEFTVEVGTPVYVPIFSVDDSPPVVGSFPTDHASAADYFFGPTEVGGSFELYVDGVLLDNQALASYLVGPVPTATLPDGGGSAIVTLGVFLSTLGAGEHVVEISGSVSGDAVQTSMSIPYMNEELVYFVTVVPGS